MKQKPVKSFEEFRKELHESKNQAEFLAEGILSSIAKAIKKIGEWFSGPCANYFNGLIRQMKGDLPKGVKIYPTSDDIKFLEKNGVKVSVPTVKESVEVETIDEAKVELDHPNSNIPNVGRKDLMEFVRDAVESGKEGTPVLIWGAPGIGKTAIVESIAKEYFGENAREEKRIIDYDLMTMSPEDFFLPVVTNKDPEGNPTEKSKSSRLPDEYLPVYKLGDKEGAASVNGPDGKGGILFFDEIARCNPRVQNVCLKLINERRLGSYILGDKWVIIAAANRAGDDDTGTYNFSSTLGNRFIQVNYSPKFEDWREWAAEAKDKEGNLLVSPEILAFVRFNHEKYFHDLDPAVVDATGGAVTIFPSPRQWTLASKTLSNRKKRYEKLGKGEIPSKEIEEIVASHVGKAASSAFIGFLQMIKKVDPDDIKMVYSDPEKAPTFKDLKIDEKNALIAAVVFHKNKKDLKDPEKLNFVNWLVKLKDAPFAIKAMVMMQEVHPELKEDEYWNDTCKATLFDNYPSLTKNN